MKNIEFCYWLQGYFEITDQVDTVEELRLSQIECIENHLKLVEKHESLGSFTSWLQGFLEYHLLSQGRVAMNDEGVDKIRAKLAHCFKHVIDNTYSNASELNKIHNTDNKVFRC